IPALADLSLSASEARSTAVLSLPAGATVTHAFMYWAGRANADATATLDRPGGFTAAVTATQSFTNSGYYQSVADVTSVVATNGNGAYRVSGVAMEDFRNL